MAKMLGDVRPCRICGPGRCDEGEHTKRSVRNDEESLWRSEAERELADEHEAIVQVEREAEYERQIHSHWAYRLLEGN